MTRIYYHLPIHDFNWENIKWARGWPAGDLTAGVVERTVARAVKLAFIFAPWNRATQMRATMPEGQHPAVVQARDEESAFWNVADRVRLKFVRLPGDDFAAKRARFNARLEEPEQRRPRLPE
jgi:hypothetical protein